MKSIVLAGMALALVGVQGVMGQELTASERREASRKEARELKAKHEAIFAALMERAATEQAARIEAARQARGGEPVSKFEYTAKEKELWSQRQKINQLEYEVRRLNAQIEQLYAKQLEGR